MFIMSVFKVKGSGSMFVMNYFIEVVTTLMLATPMVGHADVGRR